MKFLRGALAFGLALISAAALAQGGGGFGGGGLGGGGGAPQGGMQGPDGGQQDRQLFLSPGDRTEWEYEAKENEAIVVTITSQVFDPAVSIVDAEGKKLAENDDIEPGNQMARLLFVAPKAGKYKAVVTNYKGTAGGPFNFQSQRFMTFPIKFGVPTEPPADRRNEWVRVTIEKPGEYVVAIRTRGDSGFRHMDPTGSDIQGMNGVDQVRGNLRYQFTATIPGAYLFQSAGASQFHVLPVQRLTTTVGTTKSEVLERDEVEEWIVEGKKDDVLEVAISGKSLVPYHALDLGDRRRTEPAPYAVIRVGAYPSRSTILMLRDGKVGFRTWMAEGAKTTYEVSVRTVGRPLPKATELTSKLDWHGGDVWTFEGKPGDVVKLRATSDVYFPYLSVMTPEGRLMPVSSQGTPPEVSLPIEVKTRGKYVVHVSGGGVGAYRLQYSTAEPRALAADISRGEIKEAPVVWRFRAEKGQDLAFRISSPSLRWRLTIVDPEGEQVGILTSQNGTNDDLLRLKVVKTGDYTVTVTAIDGTSGPYQIKRIDLDR